MELLGILACGPNEVIEIYVKQLYSHEDTLAFATDKSLPMLARRAFLKYNHGVYWSKAQSQDAIVLNKTPDELRFLLRD